MRCGKGIGMWERFGKCKKREKKNSSDTSDQCKDADGRDASSRRWKRLSSPISEETAQGMECPDDGRDSSGGILNSEQRRRMGMLSVVREDASRMLE